MDSQERYEGLTGTLTNQAYETERCECERPRKEHADIILGIAGLGHGGIPGVCEKYTWDGKSGPFAV